MLHLRRGHRKERACNLPAPGVASHGLRKKTSKVLLLPDNPGVPGDDRMRTDDFSTDPDGHLIVVKFQNGISPGIPVEIGRAHV